MKPANKAREAHRGGVCGGGESVERRAGAKGNTHQQSTYWTQSQVRVSQALARIRQLVPSHTRGRSRMRESRTYWARQGACDETHVPTATAARVKIHSRLMERFLKPTTHWRKVALMRRRDILTGAGSIATGIGFSFPAPAIAQGIRRFKMVPDCPKVRPALP